MPESVGSRSKRGKRLGLWDQEWGPCSELSLVLQNIIISAPLLPTHRVGEHRFLSAKSADIGEVIRGRISVLD